MPKRSPSRPSESVATAPEPPAPSAAISAITADVNPLSYRELPAGTAWANLRLRLGTSGYSYAPWKGSFYPAKLKSAEMLGYYARRFPTVEINNTFYRMPTKALLGQWLTQVPEGFRFAIKMPQTLTHRQKLSAPETPATTAAFFDQLSALGPSCGPVLVQLPPFLRCDVAKLEAFLAMVPPGFRLAFEFRHPSWMNAEVVACLSRAGAALCHAETDEESPPFEPWGEWGYLRLRKTSYEPAELDRWAARLKDCAWQDISVFFKHEDEGLGPALARELEKRLS
jgi:uncharacterized protein YecE (DUF72 family)